MTLNIIPKPQNEDAEQKHLLGLFADSSFRKELEQRKDGERVEKQKAELGKLAPLRKQRDTELPALKAKREKAQQKEERLLADAKAATHERMSVCTEESQRAWWYTHQEEKILGTVQSLAPACINDFLFELRELEVQARLSVCSEVRTTKKNPISDQRVERFVSNTRSVQKRIDAIRAARKAAEDLRLQPLSEPEIKQRLEELKTGLPLIDDHDEVTDVRMPDVSELRRFAL